MSRTTSVFEYGTLRVASPAGRGATDALTQGEFDALVRFNDSRQQRLFSVGHRAITFRQYVGYLQVGDLGIEVLPKADRGLALEGDVVRWRSMLLEMLRVGLGIDLRLSDPSTQHVQRPSLIELVVAHLMPKVEGLTREGLARNYREEEANGPTFRGRLLFPEHIRQNSARADRCFVRYQVYDRDAPVNRALRAALEVAARSPLSPPLRSRVLASLPHFESARRVSPRAEVFERLVFNRSTERYRDAAALSRMLVEGLAPALRTGGVPVFSLLFDMNALWERYIGVLCKRACPPGMQATLQSKRAFWQSRSRRPRIIRPDIFLSRTADGAPIAVLDTKWKLADASGPSDDDLKQMFAYNEMFGTRRAILLHPATQRSSMGASGIFSERAHDCAVLELFLEFEAKRGTAAILMQLKERLAQVAASD